jgi:hypothetical protein
MLYTEITVENQKGELLTRAFTGNLYNKIESLLKSKVSRPYSVIEAAIYDDSNMKTIAWKKFY